MSTRTFLVERYWPGIDDAGLRAALPRLDEAARAIRTGGRTVEHVGSLLMPNDQVVFSVIRADSEAVALELNALADLPVDRIAEVTAQGFDRSERRRR